MTGRIGRVAAYLAAALLLLAPALWNRFPLLQYDTGGYLARWYEGYLVPSRAVAYGLFLHAATPLSFWPAVIVQAALTLWIVALVLRLDERERTPARLLAVVGALAAATSLPFLASILLTDIFAGLAVFALHLLLYRAADLARWERAGLMALVAFAAATHSATFAVLLAILCGSALVSWFAPRTLPRASLLRAAGTLAAGAVLTMTANYSVSGKFAWTPGGSSLAFGRMLQDGIVARYLNDRCPEARLKLCPHRADLPKTADDFLWSYDVFNELGRFDGLGAEMEEIVVKSLAAYPWMQAKTAAIAAAEQIVTAGSGHGIHDSLPHTYGIIERYIPSVAPAMRAARQQKGEFGFERINLVHIPVALLSTALIAAMIGQGLWRRRFDDQALMALTVAQAIVANAVVCGVISGPHDRYGARIVWIATFVVALALARALAETRDLRPRPIEAGSSADPAPS